MKDEGDAEKKTKFGGEMRKKLSLVENTGFFRIYFCPCPGPTSPSTRLHLFIFDSLGTQNLGGHCLNCYLLSLGLVHPWYNIRDTSKYEDG